MSDTSASRNQRIIDELLAEAGMEDAGDLRPVLLELRAFAGERPRPSAQVEALMAPSVSGHLPASTPVPFPTAATGAGPATDSVPAVVGEPVVGEPVVDELAARRRSKRRLPLTALSVAVALAAGGAAAAASDEGVRHTLGNVNHAVTFFVGTLTTGTRAHTADNPSTGAGGTAPDAPSPTPTASVPSPTGSGTTSGGQQGQGTTPVPAAPSSHAGHTPGLTLPGQPDPGDLGTVPGQGPDGKPLPTPWVSAVPSVAPTPPVELPIPGPPSPTPER